MRIRSLALCIVAVSALPYLWYITSYNVILWRGKTGILGVAIRSDGDQPGIIVRGVLRGGPAERAGINPGDVITAVDGVQTPDGTALTDVLDRHHPGDTVSLTYLKVGNASQNVPVTLADGPPN